MLRNTHTGFGQVWLELLRDFFLIAPYKYYKCLEKKRVLMRSEQTIAPLYILQKDAEDGGSDDRYGLLDYVKNNHVF